MELQKNVDIEKYEAKLAILQEKLMRLPPAPELPLEHHFSGGTYSRKLFIPKGAFVIGKKHKTEHPNDIVKGSCLVTIDGETALLKAPYSFISEAGCKKVVYALEDVEWITTHKVKGTNIEKIETELIEEEPRLQLTNEQLRREVL
jgi:hypothetical protein